MPGHILQTPCMNGKKTRLAVISHRANTAVCYSDREVLDIAAREDRLQFDLCI